MIKYKKWAKHIINRFGRANALRYALTGANCPCDFLEKKCSGCEHCDIKFGSSDIDWWCNTARDFYHEFTSLEKIMILKNRIRGC